MKTLQNNIVNVQELELRNTIAEDIRYKFLPMCDCTEHDPTHVTKLINEIIKVIIDGI